MGWQHKITKMIIDKGADYLIAVKGNQQRLYDSIKQAFACANKTSTLHMEKDMAGLKPVNIMCWIVTTSPKHFSIGQV
jgi:predicted transposase YbfD/YdcC